MITIFKIENIEQKIKQNQPVVGTHIKWTDSTIAEILAISGFDFVWIDSEHGIMTIETINNHIRAIQGGGAAAFLRVPWNDPVRVKPYLEMGVDGIIFPFVNSRQDAERAVASCLYPPEGIRGFGPGRINNYGFMDIDEYFEKAKQIWKIVQIEHIDAVNNLDEILTVRGISAVVIGPYDLSVSMGLPAQIKSNEVKKQLDRAAEKCLEAGIPFGTSFSFDAEMVEEWYKRGASFVTLGGDQDFIRDGAAATLANTLNIHDNGLNKPEHL